MSMIGTILLEEIVVKKKVSKADQVLNELHQGVVKSLKQDRRSKASKDGMDIALCVINQEDKILEFAGAFRPLVHFSNAELNRIRSDAAPIGGFRGEEPSFNCHRIDYQKGDVFYVYTDGFADQFGGSRGKKYMTRNFRQFLEKIHRKELKEQKNLLVRELDNWMGSLEQVDDILVIGFKL